MIHTHRLGEMERKRIDIDIADRKLSSGYGVRAYIHSLLSVQYAIFRKYHFEDDLNPIEPNTYGGRCSHAIEYIQDCDSLIKKLYHWLESLQELEKGPVW